MTESGQSALLTDLYQLTMLNGYLEHGMEQTACFEFFVRNLPDERNYLVAAGLEQALDFLEDFRFSEDELDWLGTTRLFGGEFLARLAGLRFRGDVFAMPEGSVFFADEPILRVEASLPEAQVVESRLINLLQFQTLVASKASRVVSIARGKSLVDFGFRRAHGAEAGLLAARAAYLAGFTGTATVLAGKAFGIPVFGTMAHSYVQAHSTELEVFRTFAAAQPDNLVLLIDTYDTKAAAHEVVRLARELSRAGVIIKAVRLDSGDLLEESRMVRIILDEAGLSHVGIFASGNLDEHRVRDLEEALAPINGYGIGTKLDVSADVPYLNCAYKLVECAGKPVRKRSVGKETLPGRKQVWRSRREGFFCEDLLGLVNEDHDGDALLMQVMQNGRRVRTESLHDVRMRVREQLAALPAWIVSIDPATKPYPLTVSRRLQSLVREVDQAYFEEPRA